MGNGSNGFDKAAASFDYAAAFSRNLGLVSPQEQEILRNSKVAVAGLGGVGGVHLTTLARSGVGNFHIADFDDFEIHNFNRQAGATMSSIGKPKSEVMRQLAADINPEAKVSIFAEGVTEASVDAFLDGVDAVADGLDFFAVEARRLMYKAAYERGIPVVAAGPIGWSSALLVFMPGGMTWNDYFAMDLAENDLDKYILFFIGGSPASGAMMKIDPTYLNLAERRGPSLAIGVQLCAGVVCAEILKILLKRGPVLAAPHYQQFDAYQGKLFTGKLRWGNRGPLQKMKFRAMRKALAGL